MDHTDNTEKEEDVLPEICHISMKQFNKMKRKHEKIPSLKDIAYFYEIKINKVTKETPLSLGEQINNATKDNRIKEILLKHIIVFKSKDQSMTIQLI